MRDDLGLDSFSISGFFLACLGARAVWAAGLLKAAVIGLFGYLCRVSF